MVALLGRGHALAGATGALHDRKWRVAMLVGVVALAGAALQPPLARADATASLASQVNEARGGCPALQLDPVLTSVAQRANRETEQYQEKIARFYPFEDPMPVLRQVGYATTKAKMLNGFGDSESKAIHGVVLFGWESIPDCSYTKYGVDVLDAEGNSFATAILAAP